MNNMSLDFRPDLRSFDLRKQINLFALFFIMVTSISANAQQGPTMEWAKGMGGLGQEVCGTIATDAAGNVYTTGQFESTADFDPGTPVFNLTSAGYRDIYVSKLDANGNFVWAYGFGGNDSSGDFGQSIATDPLGNVYISGFFSATIDFDPGPGVFNLTPADQFNTFILKLTGNGNFVWAKSFQGTGYPSTNPTIVDTDGNLYLTGKFSGIVDFDPGADVFNLNSDTSADAFVVKLDTDGNFVWAKSWGGTNGGEAFHAALDPLGNIFVAGLFQGTVDFDPGPGTFNLTATVSDSDEFLVKLDNDGNFIWAKAMGTQWNFFRVQSITSDASGNIYTAGHFQNTFDFDPGAGVFNLTSSGNWDIFISKLDGNGNFVWAKNLTGSSGNYAYEIAADNTGNIFVTGSFYQTVDFDPGALTFNLTAHSFHLDSYILKLDANGNFIWAGAVGGSNDVSGRSLVVHPDNTVLITGMLYGTTDFDFSACIFDVSSKGNVDAFIQKIRPGVISPAPTITSFSPTTGPTGTEVIITGTNFSTLAADNTVRFFNNIAATVTASTTTSITTTVPAGATTGRISVTRNCLTVQSTVNFTIGGAAGPTITSFTPASGPIGTTVTITGTNFSTTPANNTVRFNGTTSTATASTATSITTSVPAGATTGKITVTVAGNTATSGTDFTVTTASGIVINPQPQSISTCVGSIETFSIDASGAVNITYQWQKFNGASFVNISNGSGYSGVTTKNLTIDTDGNFGAGDYRCRVSGNATPDVMSQTVSLEINSYPLAEISINGSLLVASPGDSYQWYQNGNEVLQATEQTFALNVAEFGSYAVGVTENGCTSTSDEFIYLVTDVEETNHGIKIYPNPFKDHIAIEVLSEKAFQIKIIDAFGRQIKTFSEEGNKILDLHELSTGTYILIIQKGATHYYHRLQKKD
jgi:hypothetical protein